MEHNKVKFFTKGDIGGITYVVSNNLVNYLIVIGTLSGVLGWPDEIVFGKVIPGLSIGLMCSGIVYTYMAYKLNHSDNKLDATALPSGISTPAMFVILYGVVMPLNYAINDPKLTWAAAMAACFIGGAIEFLGGFIGPWLKEKLPRAALLGTVAGIGFIWMATQGVFSIYSDPVIGLPIFAVAMFGLFGGYLFPKKIPPLIVAIVGGIIYAFLLGRTHFDFSGIGFYFPNPANTFETLLSGFAIVAPYLTIIIPVNIYNFFETMDNVEAANAAGDNYNIRYAQFTDGICTMISAVFGGVVPNTVWLGHAGLKKSGAGVGYTAISGIVLGISGFFGLFTFFNGLVPPAICAVTFLWCAVLMVSQAFKDCNVKHYAAIGVAMIPPVADYLYSQITGALGTLNVHTEKLANGLNDYSPAIKEQLVGNGVMWDGIPAVKSGAVIIGILLGTITVFIIDKRLDKVGFVALAAAALSFVGFIHSAELGLNISSPFGIAYLIVAAICFVMHKGKNSYFQAEDDFEYL
ncbi:MAG: xanthine/uracil/vitamin C permease [Clostridium sp.]